jgi:phthiocerol/phenolphthiocerol synthesis type-I polyketide synthase C
VAAGTNLILSPAVTVNFSEAGAMAADGRCKSFDARADGYVRSEGVGAVILKPLAQAVADGDRVYAVILGSAVNQDGRTNGLMAPNPRAQEEVLQAAYQQAGVNPGDISYVESHGTGTLLGDPIEAKALGVLSQGRAAGSRCRLGSVKSNIGHLEAAAGIAGLIKVSPGSAPGPTAAQPPFPDPQPPHSL